MSASSPWRWRRSPLFLQEAAVAALGALALEWRLSPDRAWGALLWSNFFFLSLALAAGVFLAIQNVSSAGWSAAFRRVPEAMTAYLPVGALLAGLLLLLGPGIFPWRQPEAQPLPGAAYLNLPFLTARTAVFFAAWIYMIGRLKNLSRRQDSAPDRAATEESVGWSAAFLVVFGVTFSLFAIDWLMALEPHWNSTIYPWYVFAGLFEAGLTAMVLLLLRERARGSYAELNEHHFHDLGKYVFAFSVFWAYLWFSQYLLVWYSNIPEETAHYVHRMAPGWRPLFWLNPIVNFAAPFALLLPARQKKRRTVLVTAGALLLGGHALDLYLLVMPPLLGPHPSWDPLQLLIFAGPAAAFLMGFERAQASVPAMAAHDPYLQESLHFQGQ